MFKQFYMIEYQRGKIYAIHKMFVTHDTDIPKYINHTFGSHYSFIPNSCVKKITNSNIWDGSRYSVNNWFP